MLQKLIGINIRVQIVAIVMMLSNDDKIQYLHYVNLITIQILHRYTIICSISIQLLHKQIYKISQTTLWPSSLYFEKILGQKSTFN